MSLGFKVTSSSQSQLIYEHALLLSKPVELILKANEYLSWMMTHEYPSKVTCPLKGPHSEICGASISINTIAYADADEIWIAWERVIEIFMTLCMFSRCSKECWKGQNQIMAAIQYAMIVYVKEVVAITTRTIAKAEKVGKTWYDIAVFTQTLQANGSDGKSCHECYSTDVKSSIIWINNEINKSGTYQQKLSLYDYIPTCDILGWNCKIRTIEDTKKGIDKYLKEQANTQTQEKKL
jgi:hypothetical protein